MQIGKNYNICLGSKTLRQMSEVFKNTLPSKLYWVLFPIETLRVVVDTTKRMLTKEKIDNQLVGQTASTPIMSVRDNQNKSLI